MVKNYYQYITPDEAVELWEHQTAGDYNYSRQIYTAILGSDICFEGLREYGGVFHAGYVAGIRSERDKRRNKVAAVNTDDMDELKRHCHSLLDRMSDAKQLDSIYDFVKYVYSHK